MWAKFKVVSPALKIKYFANIRDTPTLDDGASVQSGSRNHFEHSFERTITRRV